MTISPNWLAAPIVIPLLAAALGLPFVRWGRRGAAAWQRRSPFSAHLPTWLSP